MCHKNFICHVDGHIFIHVLESNEGAREPVATKFDYANLATGWTSLMYLLFHQKLIWGAGAHHADKPSATAFSSKFGSSQKWRYSGMFAIQVFKDWWNSHDLLVLIGCEYFMTIVISLYVAMGALVASKLHCFDETSFCGTWFDDLLHNILI